MTDIAPAIQLTNSTQAALQRIATAPATSEQGLSQAALEVFWQFNHAASGRPDDWHYLPAIAAAIRTAAEQAIPLPGHQHSAEWLAGYQAARRAMHEQLQVIATELESHGQA